MAIEDLMKWQDINVNEVHAKQTSTTFQEGRQQASIPGQKCRSGPNKKLDTSCFEIISATERVLEWIICLLTYVG